MDRVFLDANVLFSSAYREDAGTQRLWRLENVVVVTSRYAAEEARRNLADPLQLQRLESLLQDVELIEVIPDRPLPKGINLPAKDQPILLAAIAVGATHLVTGDFTHFGRYYGKRIEGVLVLPPADYLRSTRK